MCWRYFFSMNFLPYKNIKHLNSMKKGGCVMSWKILNINMPFSFSFLRRGWMCDSESTLSYHPVSAALQTTDEPTSTINRHNKTIKSALLRKRLTKHQSSLGRTPFASNRFKLHIWRSCQVFHCKMFLFQRNQLFVGKRGGVHREM